MNYMNTAYLNPYSLKLEPLTISSRSTTEKRGGWVNMGPIVYQLYREILSSSEYTRSFKVIIVL